jgi:hypothetical protein
MDYPSHDQWDEVTTANPTTVPTPTTPPYTINLSGMITWSHIEDGAIIGEAFSFKPQTVEFELTEISEGAVELLTTGRVLPTQPEDAGNVSKFEDSQRGCWGDMSTLKGITREPQATEG